jgi:hypothetical protein
VAAAAMPLPHSRSRLRDRIQAVIFAYEQGVIRIGSHDQ